MGTWGAQQQTTAMPALPSSTIEDMERVRLQTEYDRAALLHYQGLPTGGPALAVGHPYPLNEREAVLAAFMPHERSNVSRLHSDIFSFIPQHSAVAVPLSEDLSLVDSNLRRMTKAEGQIRLHPRDSILHKSNVKHYDSQQEERARRFDELRSLPARFTSARRDLMHTGADSMPYTRNEHDRKQARLQRAFLL